MIANNFPSYPPSVHNSSSQENVPALQFATQSRRLMPWIVGGIGVALIVGGVAWQYVNSYHNTSGKVNVSENETSTIGGGEKSGTVAGVESVKVNKIIYVDISGSVVRPGIVQIPNDSRIQDVLIAAGGLAPNADRNYVSKYINLAQHVSDGMKIYIPKEGENINSNVGGGLQGDATNLYSNVSGVVNINVATASELDSLPGVGMVTANKIISGRPYQNVSELISRKIIGQSVFEKIKDKVSTF